MALFECCMYSVLYLETNVGNLDLAFADCIGGAPHLVKIASIAWCSDDTA